MAKIALKINLRSEAGASIMEVLFATAIFAAILVAMGSGFNHAASMNAYIKNKSSAANDAKKIMEQVRMLTDTSGLAAVMEADTWKKPDGTGWLQQNINRANEDMGVTFPDCTDQNDPEPSDCPENGDPLHVRVIISWQEKTTEKQFQLDGLFTQRLITAS